MSKEPSRSLSSIPQRGSMADAGRTTTQQPLDPLNLPSLPEWLTSRLGMVSRQNGYRRPASIPESRQLSSQERMEVGSLLITLNGLYRNTSLNHPQTANEVLGAITRLLLALPSKASGEATGEAKAEAYMIALEDMPAWAITVAIRGWYRGEHGPEHNYTFAPAPVVLRRLVMIERHKVAGRATALGELLEAVPEVEYSDEYRAEMLGKLRSIGVGR